MTAALVAEGLVRRFEREVVSGVSLTLEAGESVALLGPSGCGKTTLMHMIGLLDRPTSGRVLLRSGDTEETSSDGWAVSDGVRASLRLSRIGFVFQDSGLLEHLTARDNVALPAWRLTGSREAALRAADALLSRLGLDRRGGAPARELSIGEKQRVAVARALVNGPRVVLADEPTGALDSVAAGRVLDALDDLRTGGAALFVVTHDAAVAARADRTVTMRDGKLTEQR